ncbi:FMN-binding negative transcriptional regulator [Qipengyuania sp. XHP0207]|uniref:FMN-binding negative transcriptional regulator n=1 Tax=Qipengyuania sp. XHP0207 TaxID=3038078 RepID=UPI00241FA5B9|nr:FMN-binding negative transcriptional regulator [Qipengyuania sp. XHP0207]MDG5749096.1 FMN-binding negative transcriptional regulator [Qipengyuania sp. XHP0207]
MHPNPLFRSEDRALLEQLIEEAGFGMVFLTTPAGPRIAHVPLLLTQDGRLRFHLARSNMLTEHLEGACALVVVNGPDGYVSPRWYADRREVPSWDYVALELEGTVSRLDDAGLETLLHQSIEHFEVRLGGSQWRASETPDERWARLFEAIVGFELEIEQWRPTLKLSQKKPAEVRTRIAKAQEALGNAGLAEWMRRVPA